MSISARFALARLGGMELAAAGYSAYSGTVSETAVGSDAHACAAQCQAPVGEGAFALNVCAMPLDGSIPSPPVRTFSVTRENRRLV